MFLPHFRLFISFATWTSHRLFMGGQTRIFSGLIHVMILGGTESWHFQSDTHTVLAFVSRPA